MWLVLALLLTLGAGLVGMARRQTTRGVRALEHEMRAWLRRVIGRSPGIRKASLHESAGVSEGTLRHHLQTLEDLGIIIALRDRHETRFFASEEAAREASSIALLRRQRIGAMVELISGRPGLCQKDLAAALGLKRKSIRSYVDLLQGQRLVEERHEGAKRRYYPLPKLDEVLRIMGDREGPEERRQGPT